MSAVIEILGQEPYWSFVRLALFLGGIAAFVGLNAAYLVWVERKTAAYVQRRPGPMEVGPQGLIQPIADAVKLLSKQVLVPPGVDGILFRIAPVLIMTPAMMCFVALPYGSALVPASLDLGLLALFAFASINVMALMLGAWSSRNKFAIISAARVVSQNIAYEIPMLLTIVTIVLMSGSLNLSEIVGKQGGWFWNWNIFQLHHNPLVWLSFLTFYICMLAETNRAPFDMAESESELVAGAFTEYAGMSFGVFFMAEYANIVVGCSLATVLFFGGWNIGLGSLLGSAPAWVGALVGLAAFFAKLYALIFTVIWIRWTFPRTQFYGLLNLSWKILIPVALVTLWLTSFLLKVI
ncbi:MAG TPA: complex I subunit 1 family protein [Opitutaceae bacterium]|nr:complex I subunit 1 family protein [Opitutaceae bacterium]